jgi:hypothetical protein
MKALKIFGISLGGLIGIGFVGLMILGSLGPETFVYIGHQVPKKYLDEIRSLALLEPDEKIKYFYTDAMFDIKDGLYFVTDKHLVLYCQKWEEPEAIINYKDIINIETEFDESFFEDSYVTIETVSGLEVSFPVSSEKGRDKKFVQHIRSKMEVEQVAVGAGSH